MAKLASIAALAVALSLGACSQDKSEPQPDPAASPPAAASADIAAQDAARASDPAMAQAGATSSADQSGSGDIPASVRGRWGMVPADCTSTAGDAKGLLIVSARELKFYESVAKLGEVKERTDMRIRGTFTYSGEGQTWTQDVVLDVQDAGNTLIRRDYGPDAQPGPLQYTRCK